MKELFSSKYKAGHASKDSMRDNAERLFKDEMRGSDKGKTKKCFDDGGLVGGTSPMSKVQNNHFSISEMGFPSGSPTSGVAYKKGGHVHKKGCKDESHKGAHKKGMMFGGLLPDIFAKGGKADGGKMAKGGEGMKRGGCKKKGMMFGGLLPDFAEGGKAADGGKMAAGGVGKIRHKQATKAGLPISRKGR